MNKELVERLIKENIDFYFSSTYLSIDYCLNNKFNLQALILIYATIDAMSSLNRKEDAELSDKKDFINWVSKYLLKENRLNCTAEEIYAARCAVIHTATAESKLTIKKKVRMIYYAYNNDEQDLQVIINKLKDKAKAVNLNKLLEALKKATERFKNVILRNNDLSQLYFNRLGKLLRNVSLSNETTRQLAENIRNENKKR